MVTYVKLYNITHTHTHKPTTQFQHYYSNMYIPPGTTGVQEDKDKNVVWQQATVPYLARCLSILAAMPDHWIPVPSFDPVAYATCIRDKHVLTLMRVL